MKNTENNLMSVLLGVEPDVAEAISFLWSKGWKIQFDGFFNCIGIKKGKKNETL